MDLKMAKQITDANNGNLYLSGTEITELPDNLTVGGWLDLSGTEITELPDNLTVGGDLYLSGTKITELPDNLTVGGNLYPSGTKITELPDNLTVGGDILINWDTVTGNPTYKKLKDGDYVPHRYLYADGILTQVKSCHEVNGYTLYSGKIKGRSVVSDGKYYAHCKNLRDGIADIAFKKARERGADQFKDLTLREMIDMTDGQYNSERFREFFE